MTGKALPDCEDSLKKACSFPHRLFKGRDSYPNSVILLTLTFALAYICRKRHAAAFTPRSSIGESPLSTPLFTKAALAGAPFTCNAPGNVPYHGRKGRKS